MAQQQRQDKKQDEKRLLVLIQIVGVEKNAENKLTCEENRRRSFVGNEWRKKFNVNLRKSHWLESVEWSMVM